MIRKATAVWHGTGRAGSGQLSSESGVLDGTPYSFKTRFENDRTGCRIATSVGGAATGEGGSIVVVDDPHSVKERDSARKVAATLAWWDEVMSTRLNDPKTGAKVIVMQRVAENDLSGHVLKQGQ